MVILDKVFLVKPVKSKEKYHDFVWQSKSKAANLNDSHLSILKLMPQDCNTILDVGCGTGNLSFHLQKEGYNVIGVDVSGFALAEAKKRGIKSVHGDLDSELPFKDKSFDCVVCCQVLQHIYEPLKLVSDMKRVGSKFIIINVPNIAYWKYRSRLLFGEFPFKSIRNHEPIRFFTLKTVKNMITDAGLILESIVYTGSPLAKAGSLFATGITIRVRKEH